MAIIAAVAALFLAVHLFRKSTVRISEPHCFALLLYGYALFSLLWSSDSKQGGYQLLNALGPLAAFFIAPYIARAVPLALAAAMVLAVLLAGVLPPETYGGFGNENFIASFLLIAAPFAFLAPVGAFLAPSIAALYLLGWNPSKQEFFVALVAGFGLLGWGTWNKTIKRRYVAVVVPIVGVALWLAWPLYSGSVVPRAEIWVDTLGLISQSPVWGHGFGSFMYEFPRLQEFHTNVFASWGIQQTGVAHHAGAVHNEYLQIVAELGLVGLALAGWFVWTCIKARRKGGIYLAALGSLGIAAVIAVIDFPTQNAATAMLIALALGILAGRGGEIEVSKAVRFGGAGVLMVVVFAALVLVGSSYLAQLQMAQSLSALGRGNEAQAVNWNEKARQQLDWDWRIRIQYPLTLASYMKHNDIRNPTVQDHYYRVGQSASPNFPALLVIRFEDLLNTERNPDEAADVVRRLKAQTPKRAVSQLRDIERFIQ